MTPRDELRGGVRELIAREGLDPAAADTLTGHIMDLLPSLPAGGGDGEAVRLLWRVADESPDGWSAGLDPDLRDLIDEWSERVACPACRGRGVVLHFTESGLDSEYLTCERCNGAGRSPASSSAGDEARKALEHLRRASNGLVAAAEQGEPRALIDPAVRAYRSAFDRLAASRSSPLQGAGTVTVCFPEAEAAALAMDATVENELAASAIKRIGDALAPAPADEETTR